MIDWLRKEFWSNWRQEYSRVCGNMKARISWRTNKCDIMRKRERRRKVSYFLFIGYSWWIQVTVGLEARGSRAVFQKTPSMHLAKGLRFLSWLVDTDSKGFKTVRPRGLMIMHKFLSWDGWPEGGLQAPGIGLGRGSRVWCRRSAWSRDIARPDVRVRSSGGERRYQLGEWRVQRVFMRRYGANQHKL